MFVVRWRWRRCRRIWACQARGVGFGAAVGRPGRVAVGQAASISSRRAWRLPVLVMCPRWRCSPEEYSLGTIPSQDAQLPRVREAGEVADLGDQPERGAGRDPAEARSGPARSVAHRSLRAICSSSRSSASSWRSSPSRWMQHLPQRRLRERRRRGAGGRPTPDAAASTASSRPGRSRPWRSSCLLTRCRAAVRAQRRSSRQRIRSRSPSVSGDGGATNDSSPGAVEPDELLRVPPVGLDPVAGADRDQRRRDHVARRPRARVSSRQQLEPARPRLVADRQPLRAAQPVDEPADRRLGRLDLLHLRLPARRRQRRRRRSRACARQG